MRKYRLLTPLIGSTVVGCFGLTISLLTSCEDKKPTPPTPTSPALCFTADGEDSTVSYSIQGTVDTSNIKYSYDGANWSHWNESSDIALEDGESMYVWNENSTLSSSSSFFHFNMTGKIAASGDVNSMINYSELTDYCYYELFNGCQSLTVAPKKLPSTTLKRNCYGSMFKNCTSLTTAPELPAQTLAQSCYDSMFYGCTSLTQATELPATDLVNYCYYAMFYGCTKLIINEETTTQNDNHLIFKCPWTATVYVPVEYMFVGCLGEHVGTPTTGNSYFWVD